jgi:hypothetical protein
MAKVYMQVECFCGMANKVTFKKPCAFSPTVETHRCADCDSDILYKFKKMPGQHKVSYDKALVRASDMLMLLMMEKESKT